MAARKGARIADIAELAGVSSGTVSKALNNTGQLSDETRRRVLEAARALGIQTGAGASAARGGRARSLTIGVLSSDDYGRFMLPVLSGVEDVVSGKDVDLVLGEIRGDGIRERHYVDRMLERRVDGILVTGDSSELRASIGTFPGLPVVYALCTSEEPSDCSIVPDDFAVGMRAARHLIGLGRRSIALVGGPHSSLASSRRVAGATAALTDAGLAPRATLSENWSENWGRSAASALLTDADGLDGVVCASDQIARGLLDELREAGISAPKRVAVIGVDNWGVMVEASRPALSSIDLNLRSIGRIAANRLLDAAAGIPLPGGVERVEPFLVTRQSA
jgi:LacI family transcriptional regulator